MFCQTIGIFITLFSPLVYLGLLDIKEHNTAYDIKFLDNFLLTNPDDYKDNIIMFSKYGTKFKCYLPNIKNDFVFSKEKSLEFLNNITNVLMPLKNTCITKKIDWWTYEYCYEGNITQYHSDNGKRRGMEAVIGRFDKNMDWKLLLESSKIYEEQLPHIQYYVNGTYCNQANKFRETEVQYFCANNQKTHINSVVENDCNYKLIIHTPYLCSHPYFNSTSLKKEQNIYCLINDGNNKNDLTLHGFENKTLDQQTPELSEESQNSDKITKGKHSFRIELKAANMDMLGLLLHKVFKHDEDREIKRVHQLQNLYFKDNTDQGFTRMKKTKKTNKDLIIFKRQ